MTNISFNVESPCLETHLPFLKTSVRTSGSVNLVKEPWASIWVVLEESWEITYLSLEKPEFCSPTWAADRQFWSLFSIFCISYLLACYFEAGIVFVLWNEWYVTVLQCVDVRISNHVCLETGSDIKLEWVHIRHFKSTHFWLEEVFNWAK